MTNYSTARHEPPDLPPGQRRRRRHRHGARLDRPRHRRALRRPFTWISPRGTLEVLDDYGYWIGKKMGYFDGLETDMQPGPSDGTATVKFVDVGQADMGFPSPGIFSFALENGMKLKSAFHWGALDTFSFAFRKGEGTNDLKKLEGKTILLGSAAWQSIVDPMLAVHGVDITQDQVRRSRLADLGHGAGRRPGRCGAQLGRPARRVDRQRPRLRVLARRAALAALCQHLRRACGRPRGSRQEGLPRQVPARLVDGPRVRATTTRWPRSQAVFEQFPTLATNVGPELGATRSCSSRTSCVATCPSATAGATTTWRPGRPSSTRS